MEDKKNHKVSLATLSLSALGVVFGDIGTSPLYTMKEVFSLSKRSFFSQQTSCRAHPV